MGNSHYKEDDNERGRKRQRPEVKISEFTDAFNGNEDSHTRGTEATVELSSIGQPRRLSLGGSEQAPSSDFEVPAHHDVDRLCVRDMFLLQDAGGQGLLIVGVLNGDTFLHDDAAVVEFFIHKMHGAASHSV